MRSRLPLWAGLLGLILLFPVIVIPLLVGAFREPAFQSVDEIDMAQVTAVEAFVLNRPDGGPDIPGNKSKFAVPPGDFDAVLSLLRKADRVSAPTSRGIYLGQIRVTLANGRSQTIYLHRPKNEYEAGPLHRVEVRIGSNQFDGPPVNEFTRRLGEIAGAAPPPDPAAK
ncbi:hypothetical protein [Limnoglobus roseus]|uniref:hypothetical protein n=1 Tax=Limnoglobus roseus TaxID=2598579 RepID=UPI0011EAB7BE|nr:hypothetical protein [Limnoglobus roseus]